MFSDRNIKIAAFMVWALVYVCAVAMWWQGGVDTRKTALVMGVVPGMYIVGRYLLMPLMNRSHTQGDRQKNQHNIKLIHLALVITGLSLLGSMIGPFLVEQGVISAEMKEAIAPRTNGIVMGIFFIIMGNYTPKMIAPLTEGGCNPAKHQALQRHIGWMFFVTGILYTLAWIFLAPLLANIVATSILGFCFLMVMPRAIYYMIKSARNKNTVDT
jgi:uncharacterized protein YneF (UPF0154 family)